MEGSVRESKLLIFVSNFRKVLDVKLDAGVRGDCHAFLFLR